MGSSSGGGGGGYMMSQVGPPMPGLPVAGSPEATIDPQNYGKYQSFLPEPLADGQNPMATGLRPEMLQYLSPKDTAARGSGALRDVLAEEVAKAPAAAEASGGGLKYLPNGQLDQNDPGNIAYYYKMMGGGGGGGGASAISGGQVVPTPSA